MKAERVNEISTKFNCLVLAPKKDIRNLRILVFKALKKGEKVENIVPFRHLRVELEYKGINRLRPIKIEYKEHGTQYIDSKRFIQMLRQAKTIYLVEDREGSLQDFARMLDDYQIGYKMKEVCRLCLLDNKITFLHKKDRYFRSRDVQFPMCLVCAMKEITDESQFRGFAPNRKFLDRVEGLLRKKFHHNVNSILKVFEPGFDASKNPEFTLYDTIEVKGDARKAFPITNYDLPDEFVEILDKDRVTTLMSVQDKAIQQGLLKGNNMLISAPTGTGKTLIGELAGMSKLYSKKRGRVLYLGNLVALVNQKYESFKERYQKFTAAIRVGMSKIDVEGEDLVIMDEDIKDADIICASYEAFEFLLRRGKEEVNNIGRISTIIIDEIQTLEDEERGAILAGLIAKVMLLFPEAQIVGLSATIGNGEEVAKLLHMTPIVYNDRPVPVERHLVLCKSEYEKLFNIVQLVRRESKIESKYGYSGSSIIFTNARWRCEYLASLLIERGINAVAYHSGLTYQSRKDIEMSFEKGLIQAVCTTYALGAGFDTPCSQVIFETCLMGIAVLSANMFLNMSGRAGRFRRQERGKVVLLIEIGKNYPGTDRTEDQIALDLLESETEPLILDYNPDLIQSQVLAAIAAGIEENSKLEEFYENLIGSREDLTALLKGLRKRRLIESREGMHLITTLGRAIALSFFTVDEGLMIVKEIHRGKDPLIMAIRLEFFENVYLTEEVKKVFLDEFKMDLPNRFFTGRIMGIAASTRFKRRLKRSFGWLSQSIALWQKVFFSCNCGNAPYCDCAELIMNQKLIDLRMKQGMTPKQISKHMERKYNLKVYSGDLLRFFDNLVHRLQGIGRIAQVLGERETEMQIYEVIHAIETPKKIAKVGHS
ncbi:MAG: DEAD/DEAH box helicase [Promethearchaeota archaeon]|nr:MAG: DEAD/DEAH box helicase [Candidatus Lokiarchaeota archaeon]